MQNVSDLRKELTQVYEELRAGSMEREQAAELANVAGKIISTAKAQLGYYKLRGECPEIGFLESLQAEEPPSK